MKSATKALIFAVLIAFAFTANLRRNAQSQVLDRLQNAGEKSQFAANLFVTLSLSLQSGSKVDEVIDFVKQAKNDAITQRNELTTVFKQQSASKQEIIDGLVTEIAVLSQQLDIIADNISEYAGSQTTLQKQLDRQKTERQGILDRKQALEAARQVDVAAFRKRQTRDQNTISALEEIIPALENLLENGNSFLEKSQAQVFAALKRIPENRPLQALVELSTQFNAAKLSEVIVKLGQILESIRNSKVEDESNESDAKQRFQAISFSLESQWNSKAKQVNETQSSLNAVSQQLKHNQKLQTGISQQLQDSQGLKSDTEGLLATSTANYQRDLATANESIEALKEALAILTENEATLASQETAAGEALD